MKSSKRNKFDWYGLSQRFSIRTYHFGAASVLLGTVMSLGLASNVSAEEVEASNPTPVTTEVAKVAEVAPTVASNPVEINNPVTDITAVKDSAFDVLKGLTALTDTEKKTSTLQQRKKLSLRSLSGQQLQMKMQKSLLNQL